MALFYNIFDFSCQPLQIMVKFVNIATYIHREFVEAFGSNVKGVKSGSSEGAEKRTGVQRLGPAGLALHYANIIIQIDAIVRFS